MFVFKAAVVGAGTMGGEIAQAIAAADIPVVLKDIDQKFVDAGLEKAREVTKGQLDRLVSKEKLTQEQADARLDEVIGLITGDDRLRRLRRRRLRDRGGAGEDGDQAGGLRRARRGHPRARDPRLQHLVALDHRDGRRDPAPRQGGRLPLLLPGVGDAAGRDRRGRGHLRETVQAAYNFAQAIRKQPITCARGPRLRRQPHPELAPSARSGARRRSRGSRSRRSTRRSRRRTLAPMGPFFLIDLLGLDTVLHVAEHLRESYGDSLLRPRGACESWSPRATSAPSPAARASTSDGEPQIEGDAEPDGEELAELFGLKALVEACLLLEEGVCTVRDIDLGMMAGAGLDPRRGLFPPFWKADLDGPRRRPREARGGRGEPRRALRAADRLLRRLVAQGRLGLKSGQGFYAYPQPDEGEQAETVKLETRGDVAHRLARQPADERDLAAGDRRPGRRSGSGSRPTGRSGRW